MHRSATRRRAKLSRSSRSGGSRSCPAAFSRTSPSAEIAAPWRSASSHASTTRSASHRQTWTRNAPEPIAMSQILRSRSSAADRSFQASRGLPSAGPDVDERLERLGDDLLGQRLRRVVRAGLAALRAAGDHETARPIDLRVAPDVLADQARDRARCASPAPCRCRRRRAGVAPRPHRVSASRSLRRRRGGSPGLFLQELDEPIRALTPLAVRARRARARAPCPSCRDSPSVSASTRTATWSSRPS